MPNRLDLDELSVIGSQLSVHAHTTEHCLLMTENSVQPRCSGASSRAPLRRASSIPGSLSRCAPLLLPFVANLLLFLKTLA